MIKMCDQIKDNERSHVSINQIYIQPERSYIRSDEGLTPAQNVRNLPLINLFDKTVFLFSTNAATWNNRQKLFLKSHRIKDKFATDRLQNTLIQTNEII